jgi:hypothetical protein
MRRAALLIAITLVAAQPAATVAANAGAETTTSVNACLRTHGWDYGLTALRHQELRVRHPNGLAAICTREFADSGATPIERDRH